MATTQNALICAFLALAFWTGIGFAVGSRLVSRKMALPMAPLLGWAVHSVIALPVFIATGMSRTAVTIFFVFSAAAAIIGMLEFRRRIGKDTDGDVVPIWAIAGAAILAFVAMSSALPTISAAGVALADPIFDHSKVAMVNDMARLGVPAGNPFFQESGGLIRLSYYYLWHFSAAEISVLSGLSGWEADAGLTWFTAFSTLSLMMGLANWLSSRTSSAAWVLVIAATASIRPFVSWLAGPKITNAVTGWPTGFGGWLFQTTWAPQHVASAGCVVIAIFLFIQLAERQSWMLALVISLVAAAAFQSSTWVGGVTFPLAAVAVIVALSVRIEPSRRWGFLLFVLTAAVIAIVFSSLFIFDQFRASIARADGVPIAVMPYDVLGEEIPFRVLFDLPAFWTVFLFTEFAAFYPIGFLFSVWLVRDRLLPRASLATIFPLQLLAFVSLAVGSVLVSTTGENNDLAWRGVLPAVFVLISFTAAGLARYLHTMRPLQAAAAVLFVALGFLSAVRNLPSIFNVAPRASAKSFADSVLLWEAVRGQSALDERVANNPLFLGDMTGWPVNISWALLANRRSCYANADLVGPFAPLTRKRREEVDTLFTRIFSGHVETNDLQQMATRYNCSVAVITPQDGAWMMDPFAASSLFRLMASKDGAWRIYRVQSAR